MGGGEGNFAWGGGDDQGSVRVCPDEYALRYW